MSLISFIRKAAALETFFSLSKIAFYLAAIHAFLRLLRARRAMDFRGRVVTITGGSRGLGLNLARQLAAEGAKIALIARDKPELDRAEAEIRALGAEVFAIAVDLRSQSAAEEAINRVSSHFGALDVLINNAGIIQVGPVEHMTQNDFAEAVDLHLWVPLWLSRGAVPHLKRSGGGRIVNIASFGGKVAMPHMAPYAVSKFALVGLSDALRHELAKDNILVTTVCPGIIRTGSHVMATFKGNQAAEYKMFKLMSALGSIKATTAARLILDAARHGDPQLVFPFPVAWAIAAYNVFPNTAGLILGLSTRFMPKPTGDAGDTLMSGHDLEPSMPSSFLTKRADLAAAANNEMNGHAMTESA